MRLIVGLFAVLALASCGGGDGAPKGEHAKTIEPLGKAYATDYGVTLEGVETAAPVVVSDANRAELESKTVQALAVGYLPGEGRYMALPYSAASDIITVKMKGDRTPADVVKAVVAPGNLVVDTTWRFAGGAPVQSVGVYAADGRLLFDTLMSMPVIEIPVARKHF